MTVTFLPGYKKFVIGRYTIEISLTPEPEDSLMESITKDVAIHLGVTVGDMRGKGRTQSLVYARMVAYLLIREFTSKSLEDTGAYFGRDHSTVINAAKRAQNETEIGIMPMECVSAFDTIHAKYVLSAGPPAPENGTIFKAAERMKRTKPGTCRIPGVMQ